MQTARALLLLTFTSVRLIQLSVKDLLRSAGSIQGQLVSKHLRMLVLIKDQSALAPPVSSPA